MKDKKDINPACRLKKNEGVERKKPALDEALGKAVLGA